MISIKIASIMIAAAFAAGSFFAPPVQQAIAAVIATDVQCTGCVGTADLAGNAVTAAKVKDGEIKAPEIATDAVGAAELQGVTKLLFGECVLSSSDANANITHGFAILKTCNISGVDSDDFAVATFTKGSPCFAVSLADTQAGSVSVVLRNVYTSSCALKAGDSIAVIVYDK